MNASLRELILQKCRKRVSRIELHDEEEEMSDTESEDMFNNLEGSEIVLEELPFEDILAEKRRTYSIKEEFIFLLYNDQIKTFVKNWEGTFLRKKPKKKIDDDYEEESEENESIEGAENYEDANDLPMNENDSKKYNNTEYKTNSNVPWKLTLPDEFANVTFINNNTYSGRISRKMMEGEGVYKWSNGAQYKGSFEQNRMHGRGLLEWNNDCWYEGDFKNGFRHGRGIMVDEDIHYVYTGQWSMGQRHGKGYCRYGDKSSYDGDWIMGKMSGVGLQIYSNGARYVGQWKNGIRHGIGTMVWANGNVYRGEWKCDAMNGYGEYVWNGFFNKTFTWPQEASYAGYWRSGKRHGKGLLKLNSVGGARYSGFWKDNKKHGHGIIIGNNGEKIEADPLFLNDILVSSDMAGKSVENESETKNRDECVRTAEDIKPFFLAKRDQIGKAPVTPILKPEQFPSLSYHLTRLLDPKSLEPPFIRSVPPGKCYTCENQSVSCLAPHLSDTIVSDEKVDTKASDPDPNWEYEERWTYNCLTLHMPRLRQIYIDYAKMFTRSAPECNLAMSRLCLWQLWRDCNIHKKGLSLVEIDKYIAKDESTLVNDLHHPFEKIEIWQYLLALLEVSWHLYTKFNDVETVEINGKLAGGLYKFLKNDVYSNAKNHVGRVYQNLDLLPMYCVFKLYKQIGYPCSAKDLLRATCVLKGTQDSQSSSITDEGDKRFSDGINCVTIGEKVSYLLKTDELFMPPHRAIEISRKFENNSPQELSAFGHLGAPKMIEIMALICHAIKDADSGAIMNMDYELTFLEFYEIILEATRRLLSLKEMADAEMQVTKTGVDAESLKNNSLQEEEPSQTVKRPARKAAKVRNKIST